MSHITIGNRIRYLRMDAGFTQEEVAAELGVTQAMVLQIERGTKQLSLLNADKLAKMFGCSINDILKEVPHHERETGNT